MLYKKSYFKLHAKIVLLSIIPLACSAAIPLLLGKIIDDLNKGFSPEVFRILIRHKILLLLQKPKFFLTSF